MSASRNSVPVQQILDRLEGVRPSGEGWSAYCPGHQDNRASLSVAEGNDGRALIFCHAGCDLSDVVSALGLEISDLFPDTRTKIPRKGAKRHGAHA